MHTCTNCGAEVAELYRRYSPSVLKVLKCNLCGNLADKYIEYDPVIVLLDLVLLQKPAYRHLLYNSGFKSYWKLMAILILGESLQKWSAFDSSFEPLVPLSTRLAFDVFQSNHVFEGERNFYMLLAQTTLSLGVFVCTVILSTELRWLLFGGRPRKYKTSDLGKALVIGGCPKLLGLLGIVWQQVSPDLHNALIHGYGALCLLTAYSVVSESGRCGSLIVLIAGFLAHNSVLNGLFALPLPASNVTLVQR